MKRLRYKRLHWLILQNKSYQFKRINHTNPSQTVPENRGTNEHFPTHFESSITLISNHIICLSKGLYVMNNWNLSQEYRVGLTYKN